MQKEWTTPGQSRLGSKARRWRPQGRDTRVAEYARRVEGLSYGNRGRDSGPAEGRARPGEREMAGPHDRCRPRRPGYGHGYQPDVDYGVRVNIAPLVEKKAAAEARPEEAGRLDKMFTQLHLQNFKGWADTGSLRLAPITVLFGSNSSGQDESAAVDPALEADGRVFRPLRVLHTGDEKTLVDLGTLSDVIFGHDLSRTLEIALAWRLPKPLEIPGERPEPLQFTLQVRLTARGSTRSCSWRATTWTEPTSSWNGAPTRLDTTSRASRL